MSPCPRQCANPPTSDDDDNDDVNDDGGGEDGARLRGMKSGTTESPNNESHYIIKIDKKFRSDERNDKKERGKKKDLNSPARS